MPSLQIVQDVQPFNTQDTNSWPPEQSDWHYDTFKGDTYVFNYTVLGILTILQQVCTMVTTGWGQVLGLALDVAQKLFEANAKYCYYTGNYSYRTWKDNVLVISAERCRTYFYSQPNQVGYLGYEMYEYSEF